MKSNPVERTSVNGALAARRAELEEAAKEAAVAFTCMRGACAESNVNNMNWQRLLVGNRKKRNEGEANRGKEKRGLRSHGLSGMSCTTPIDKRQREKQKKKTRAGGK